MSHLRVTLVQANLAWEDPVTNRNHFDHLMGSVQGATDLVVLPEMFTTGFTMAGDKWAESMDGPSVRWLRKKAVDLQSDVAGSLIIRQGGRLYNRLVWANAAGQIYFYDKRHLFRMSGEHRVYSAGDKPLTVNIGTWRIRPFICYDLRFPIWTRNLDNAYDVALFVANWPAARAAHWTALLKARAIENQVYVIGVNRVGPDGNGHAYNGETMALDPQGQILYHAQNREAVHTVDLDAAAQEDYRQRFPAWRDADSGSQGAPPAAG